MDAIDILIKEVPALFGGPVDAHLHHAFGIFIATAQALEQGGREYGAGCEVGHSLQTSDAGDRHDARLNRHVDFLETNPFLPIMECVVVEEQLGADPVGPGVDLGLQVIHAQQAVGCVGVSFGKSGHADPERAAVSITECLDVLNQISGMIEVAVGIPTLSGVCRWITAQGKDVSDSGLGVSLEDGVDLMLAVADAGEVGHRGEAGFIQEADDQLVGVVPGRPSGSISHGNERGFQGFEFRHPLEEIVETLRLPGREEFEGNRMAIRMFKT